MTAPDRPTLKGLNDQLQQLSAAVARLTTSPDKEASVAGKCVLALDTLKEQRNSGYGSDYYSLSSQHVGGGYDYQPLYVAPRGPIPRVLDFLRQRYDIPDPASEALRLSAEIDRAYRKISTLEQRLATITGALS